MVSAPETIFRHPAVSRAQIRLGENPAAPPQATPSTKKTAAISGTLQPRLPTPQTTSASAPSSRTSTVTCRGARVCSGRSAPAAGRAGSPALRRM